MAMLATVQIGERHTKRDDLIWLAGILEGEGSFDVQRNKQKSGNVLQYARLQCRMTDEDVMQRVARILDRPLNGPYLPKNPKHKPFWNVKWTAARGLFFDWLRALQPLMGRRRQSEIATLFCLERSTSGKESHANECQAARNSSGAGATEADGQAESFTQHQASCPGCADDLHTVFPWE